MNHTDETGRLYVDDTAVYAKISGGVLHVMTRAVDEDTFNQVALQVGLVVDSNGVLMPADGITITHIGPYVITPGTYDDEGVEITPPVLDNRFHVNFWLSPEATKRGEWEAWIVQWMLNGTLAEQNKSEVALKYQGIELIDPVSIQTPSNVLL